MSSPPSHPASQEIDIFNPQIRNLGGEKLYDGFIQGVSSLTREVVGLELVTIEPDDGVPIQELLDRIDEAVHEQEEPDTNLSKKIGRLLLVAEKPDIEVKLSDVSVTTSEEGSIIYKRSRSLEEQREEWKSRRTEIDELLTPAEILVLPHLHKPRKKAVEDLRLTGSMALTRRIGDAKQKLGLDTAEELALWALEHGIEFDLTEPPEISKFTLRERQVACNLWRKNPEIPTHLGITPRQVQLDKTSLYQKVGADSRTELALIARYYGFEPSPEELASSAGNLPEVLRIFTKQQRKVIPHIHLPDDVATAELGYSSPTSVRYIIQRARERADVPNRIALALKLFEGGLRFDVRKPKKPLGEILTEDELEFVYSLNDPELDRDLAEELDAKVEDVQGRVYNIKGKTGARTRLELILMVRQFDNGESKPVPPNLCPKKERLFEALGIDPVPLEQVRPLLRHTTPRQAEFIEAYYFAGDDVSWRDVAKEFNVVPSAAVQRATQGFAKIRKKIENRQ